MIPLPIAVQINADGDSLLSSTLLLSDQFDLIIEGASTHLELQLQNWVESYLNKKPGRIELPFDGTPFQTTVWRGLTDLPFGTTLSYSEFAARIGKPNSARAVGNAAGKNPLPLFIPCHRIVHKAGGIGGFSLDLEIKKRLLEHEKPL